MTAVTSLAAASGCLPKRLKFSESRRKQTQKGENRSFIKVKRHRDSSFFTKIPVYYCSSVQKRLLMNRQGGL